MAPPDAQALEDATLRFLRRRSRTRPDLRLIEWQGLRAVARGRSGTYETNGGSLRLDGAEGPFSATAFLDRDRTDAYRERAEFEDVRKTLEADLAGHRETVADLQRHLASRIKNVRRALFGWKPRRKE